MTYLGGLTVSETREPVKDGFPFTRNNNVMTKLINHRAILQRVLWLPNLASRLIASQVYVSSNEDSLCFRRLFVSLVLILNPATPRRTHRIAAQAGLNAATRLINDRGGGISMC
jgi:hypothetical protein